MVSFIERDARYRATPRWPTEGMDKVLDKTPTRLRCRHRPSTLRTFARAARGLETLCAHLLDVLPALRPDLQDVCLHNRRHVLHGRAGIVGGDGPTHHGLLDIAYLRGVPNMIAMAPKDEAEMRDMLHTMLHYEGPAAMRYPRGNGVGADIKRAPQLLEVGKAEILRDAPGGGEVAIVAYGSMVHPALAAAEQLAREGVEATVVNARFVKPLDAGLLLALGRTKRLIVTVEEAYLAGGFGSAVMELLEENGLLDGVRVVRMACRQNHQARRPQLLLAK